jgi:hypothetical protein
MQRAGGYPPVGGTMKPSQTFRFGLAAVVLAFMLAGCAVHPSAPDSPSGSATPGATSSPPVEPTTGTESPESPTAGAIAITLAPAPVGRQGTSGDNDECIQVSWLGNPIPRGDVVTVTGVNVVSPFTFDTTVTAQCEGAPSCLNYQFSAANDSGQFCNVGLGYKYGSIDLQNGSEAHGTLGLTGSLSCPSNISFAACQHDKAAMQRPGIGTISFEVFTIDKTSTPSSPPESPSSSSESPSSSSATPGSSPPIAPGSP